MSIDLNAIRASSSDRQLCGVCGGLGEHTPIPAWLWRVAFVVLTCWQGYGLGLYLIVGLLMPQAEKRADIRCHGEGDAPRPIDP